jgi:Lipocalin-like domain
MKHVSNGVRVLAAWGSSMLVAASAFAQAPDKELVGLWKLESFYAEIKATGEKRNLFGDKPKGYVYFSPGGRVLSLLTADSRPKPKADPDFAAAMRSMYSVSGTYTTKGDTYTVNLDVVWNENQPTKLTRDYKVEGNKLTVVTAWAPSPLIQGNPESRGVSVWSRSK